MRQSLTHLCNLISPIPTPVPPTSSSVLQVMEKVSNRDIPSSLSEKLDSLMLQRAEEARRTMQEKAFKTYRYATEEDIRGFHNYRREADFISLESMSAVKIMEGSTYMRLYLTLAQLLQIAPCDIRLWSIDSVEKSCNQRVNKQLSLEELQDSYIDHNKFYVEDLFGVWAIDTAVAVLSPNHPVTSYDSVSTLVLYFLNSLLPSSHWSSQHRSMPCCSF